LHQIDVLSNPIYECERDKFTRQYFLFLKMSQEKSLNQTHDLSNPINECERDKFTRQYFLFLDESEKSLNQTRWGVSRWHVMGEAKAPMQDFCERSATYE
jgi:hypothetical protein